MIEAGIEKILDLAPPTISTIDGRTYSNQVLHPIAETLPTALAVHTLTGLVDYLKEKKDEIGDGCFVHVESDGQVSVRSGLVGPFVQRKCFLVAKPPESRPFPFGSWLDLEPFIIELQAKFVPDDTTRDLLQMISSIKDEAVKTSGDDGFSQMVTAKVGIALVESVRVPNPVTLRPYRTFMEVDQPPSGFVLRLRTGVQVSLHEADGGQWRLEAIKAIKGYLSAALTGIPVIA